MSDALSHLQRLEPLTKLLEPNHETRKSFLNDMDAHSEHFLKDIDERPAYVLTEDRGQAIVDSPFEETPGDLSELLELYDESVNHPGLNPASGGHLGYIPGGGIYTSALGDFIAAVTNRYAGVYYANPGAVRMENMLVRWCADLVGYPESAAGALLSGGSIANLSCIVTARDAKGIRSADTPSAVIYLTEQVHHCVTKAIRIAGLGEAQIRYVPIDDRFRMRADALQELVEADQAAGLKPFLVVASVGTTDTGAVDPIEAIADIAEAHGLWYHLDAAYGGFFILCEEGRRLLPGLDRSDSIVMDPHKGMFIPYGLGICIVKDGQQLANSHHYSAAYLLDALDFQDEASPADLSPELTKHFRGLRMWLPMKLHGLAPFRAGAEEKLWLARYFWEKLPELPHCERGPYPDLSIVLYRFTPPGIDPNQFNDRMGKHILADGRVFLSSTRINGDFYFRMASLAFRTHRHTIEKALTMLGDGYEATLKEFQAKSVD